VSLLYASNVLGLCPFAHSNKIELLIKKQLYWKMVVTRSIDLIIKKKTN